MVLVGIIGITESCACKGFFECHKSSCVLDIFLQWFTIFRVHRTNYYWCYFGFKIVDVSEEILKIKQEIETELHGEDQTWARSESNVSSLTFFYFFLF